jgi:phosphoadenosine phosphosulfate reductase
MNIEKLNSELLGKTPEQRVKWALSISKNPIITTNFRPYEGAILHLVCSTYKDIPVVWCDTGYNTPNTYSHAFELTEMLDLKIDLFTPLQSTAYREVQMGLPSVEDANHEEFTYQVKIEPFLRAFEKHKPDLWFTNLRKGQTQHRDGLGVLSKGKDGVLKFSPFYDYKDEDLDSYLIENKIPNEFKYFDPTKVHADRECGLHKVL